MDNNIFEEIKKYSQMNKLSIFVGAGVSKLAGYPSWNELVEEMATDIGYISNTNQNSSVKFSPEELLKIPQMYYIEKNDSEYKSKVQGILGVKRYPTEVHYKILALNPNHILTTNYDTLIEETSVAFGKNYSVINSDKVVSKTITSNYIVKVHGDLTEGFVLKEEDYLNYEVDYILTDNLIKTIFATNLVIFIGYGLNDYNIKLILNWVRRIQKDSFIKPIFIHVGDRIDSLEKKYQEDKGLKIIDSNDFISANSSINNNFSAKYNAVLDRILTFNGELNLSTDNSKIEYIYEQLNGIKNLEYIRYEDFDEIFKNAYKLNEERTIENFPKNINDSVNIDYFETFFSYNEDDIKDENIENEIKIKEKFRFIKAYLNKVNIFGPRERNDFQGIEIRGLAFNNEFENMAKFCEIEAKTIKQKYKKAYYLARLAKYKESYNLFTEILQVAKEKEDWDIYYFSFLNRQYLYTIVESIDKNYSFDFLGFNKLDDEFKNILRIQMKNYSLEKQFDELPFSFKEKYKSLKDLTSFNCYLTKYYDFTKTRNKVEKDNQKKSRTFGLAEFDREKWKMLDTTKFMFDNMLLFDLFTENNSYIKNVMQLWLEAIFIEENYNYRGPFAEIKTYRLVFNLQDIIIISKSFPIDEIEYISRKIDLSKLIFDESYKLEEYILMQIQEYTKLKDNILNKENHFILEKFIEQIFCLLNMSVFYIEKDEVKLKIIDFVIELNKSMYVVIDRKIELIEKFVRYKKLTTLVD